MSTTGPTLRGTLAWCWWIGMQMLLGYRSYPCKAERCTYLALTRRELRDHAGDEHT